MEPEDIKKIVTFGMQIGVSLLWMIFCMFQLASSGSTAEIRAIYLPQLTTVIALWIPSPKLKGQKPDLGETVKNIIGGLVRQQPLQLPPQLQALNVA
jgi:hypothetical protein